MKRIIIAAAMLQLLLAGCSKVNSADLKEDIPYFQNYEVYYDKTNNIYTAMAGFRIHNSSGTAVQLSGNASVKLNGSDAWTNGTDKTTYHWNGTGLPDVNFVLTKNSGQSISNSIRPTGISDIGFASLPATLSKTNGFTFTWSGDPLDSINEWMGIDISVTTGTGGSAVFTKSITGNPVVITPEDLANVAAGKITLELYRGKKMDLNAPDGDAGGNTTIRESISREITLNN